MKHFQPLFGASWRIISWNLRGNLCESCAITRLIWVLVHSLQGRGHLPASTSGAKTKSIMLAHCVSVCSATYS